MTPIQQSKAAAQFAKEWANKGYEKGHTQTFWLELLQKVFGVENPYGYINFEDQVMVDSTNSGKPFWSCSDYPNCHGTRKIE